MVKKDKSKLDEVNSIFPHKAYFSMKATKFDKNFTFDLTFCGNCQIDGEDCVNFSGHLGTYELYILAPLHCTLLSKNL